SSIAPFTCYRPRRGRSFATIAINRWSTHERWGQPRRRGSISASDPYCIADGRRTTKPGNVSASTCRPKAAMTSSRAWAAGSPEMFSSRYHCGMLRVGLLGIGDAGAHHARALVAAQAEGLVTWSVVGARDMVKTAARCAEFGMTTE